jgi:hypothetical protein
MKILDKIVDWLIIVLFKYKNRKKSKNNDTFLYP